MSSGPRRLLTDYGLRAMGEGTGYAEARISGTRTGRHVFKWQQEQRRCSDVVGVSKGRKRERETHGTREEIT